MIKKKKKIKQERTLSITLFFLPRTEPAPAIQKLHQSHFKTVIHLNCCTEVSLMQFPQISCFHHQFTHLAYIYEATNGFNFCYLNHLTPTMPRQVCSSWARQSAEIHLRAKTIHASAGRTMCRNNSTSLQERLGEHQNFNTVPLYCPSAANILGRGKEISL